MPTLRTRAEILPRVYGNFLDPLVFPADLKMGGLCLPCLDGHR